ncbi:GntR family transcriptional regulator [Paenibacillus thailandensis]|uniref:GntR family transcriptional regulator n=1 Tax=Paenibacillus thailandensis TaxID=393250 RepID=A0ABW5R2X4_9BACL
MSTTSGWTSIQFNARDPVYLQVVRHVKEQIATGGLEAGQLIPSRRELAALLKINPNTAQKAYKELEEQRLIITEGNSPSRITSDKELLRQIRMQLISEEIEAFISSIRKINVPVDELLEIIKTKYEEGCKQGGESRD